MTCPRTAGKEKGNKTTTNKSGRTSTEEGGGEKNRTEKNKNKKNPKKKQKKKHQYSEFTLWPQKNAAGLSLSLTDRINRNSDSSSLVVSQHIWTDQSSN